MPAATPFPLLKAGKRLLLAAAVVLVSVSAWSSAAGAQTALTISGTLGNGTVGVPYHATLTASGGTAPYSWSFSGFPGGFVFNGGTVGGTPTTAGAFTVDVTVFDQPNVDGLRNSAKKQFAITIAPAPPPPTTTTTTTTVPTTTTTKPTVPRTTTTTRATTTTTTAASTTTTVTTLPSAPVTTPRPTTSTPPPSPTPSTLQLSQPSTEPGGEVTASGRGCSPGANVQLSIDATAVGSATADASGDFSAPLTVPDLPLGSHTVVASCGPTLSSPLDLAVSTSSDAGTGTLGIFFFFLLLVLMLFRRRHLVRRRKVTGVQE